MTTDGTIDGGGAGPDQRSGQKYVLHGQRQPQAITSNGNEADNDIDIRNMLLMLWRRKLAIVGIMLIFMSLTLVLLSFVQPRYTARSLVLLENDANALAQMDPQLQNLVHMVKLDTSLVLNEVEVIRSREMAKKVISRLNLINDPDFNKKYALPASEQGEGSENFKALTLGQDQLTTLPDSLKEQQISSLVTGFLESLRVRSVPGSNVIEIEYQSVSPRKAALIANAVADEYIEQRLETKFQSTRKVTDWLDKRLDELRSQVRSADRAVQEYKQKHNITEGVRSVVTVTVEQLSQLNAQLITAKAEYAEAIAKLQEIESLARNQDRIETATEVINSRLIQELKRDEADLLRQLSDLETRYGDRHPDIINLRTELDDLRIKIRTEMEKIVESMRNEMRIAEARVKALQQGIDEIKQEKHIENEAMIQLDELMREAKSSRLIFDTFLQTYKRSDEQEELQEPEARVLSYAVIPRAPSYPDRLLLLSLAASLSLFIGLALAFLLDKLDNTFRSAGQLERMGHFPCFALIPAVDNLKQNKAADFILSKPSSTVAESVRTLRTVLNLRGRKEDMRPKIVTITSSFPGEGKTTLSCWLSRLAAKSGERVILIDGDLRRPSVHKNFGIKPDMTLVEYLTGKASLQEAIYHDEKSDLDILTSKSVPNSALDLVSGSKMKELVEQLKEEYDLVIIDSPACLAVSDARVLATMSDHSIYAVAWDRTPREVVLGGVKQFADMGYEPLAFVLTNVDVQKHVRYGYGDTVYYYGRYKEYYSS